MSDSEKNSGCGCLILIVLLFLLLWSGCSSSYYKNKYEKLMEDVVNTGHSEYKYENGEVGIKLRK